MLTKIMAIKSYLLLSYILQDLLVIVPKMKGFKNEIVGLP